MSHHLSKRQVQSASNHTLGSETSLGHLESSVENGGHNGSNLAGWQQTVD